MSGSYEPKDSEQQLQWDFQVLLIYHIKNIKKAYYYFLWKRASFLVFYRYKLIAIVTY